MIDVNQTRNPNLRNVKWTQTHLKLPLVNVKQIPFNLPTTTLLKPHNAHQGVKEM